jgi:hypothetical protein
VSYYEIDPELRATVEPELYNGETLLWAGKRKPGALFRRFISGGNNNAAALVSVMVGLMVTVVFGLFVFASKSQTSSGMSVATMSATNDTPFVVFMPLIFIILGLAVFAKVWLRRSNVGRAIYALTDQRAIIISQGLAGGRSIKSYGEADIDRIERRTYRDGTGDIIFAQETHSGAFYGGPGVYGRRNFATDIGFLGIPDAREVELLMLETFKMHDSGNKHKYKHDELGDDGELIFEDDYQDGKQSKL